MGSEGRYAGGTRRGCPSGRASRLASLPRSSSSRFELVAILPSRSASRSSVERGDGCSVHVVGRGGRGDGGHEHAPLSGFPTAYRIFRQSGRFLRRLVVFSGRQVRTQSPLIGVDVVEPARLRGGVGRTPALREELFHPGEIAYSHAQAAPMECLAGRFAAKEAVVKALGLDNIDPLDIEVVQGGER